jgi:predicted nuclease of predicted toxin-antitoxin system
MKLLLDQNLSPKLIELLKELYPDSVHVSHIGLDQAADQEVWDYARTHQCTIVTKDADFGELSMFLDFPPYVVWIRRGNCSTRDIEQILRTYLQSIQQLTQNTDNGVLMLF